MKTYSLILMATASIALNQIVTVQAAEPTPGVCASSVTPDDCRVLQAVAASPAKYPGKFRLKSIDYGSRTVRMGYSEEDQNEALAQFEQEPPHTPAREVFVSYRRSGDSWTVKDSYPLSGRAIISGIAYEVAEKIREFLSGQGKLKDGFKLSRLSKSDGSNLPDTSKPRTKYIASLVKRFPSRDVVKGLELGEEGGSFVIIKENSSTRVE